MSEAKKHSILVVDDAIANINALRTILHPSYTVYAVSDSLEALEAAQECQPDVILLDIVMPDMDGFEVLSALGFGLSSHSK